MAGVSAIVQSNPIVFWGHVNNYCGVGGFRSGRSHPQPPLAQSATLFVGILGTAHHPVPIPLSEEQCWLWVRGDWRTTKPLVGRLKIMCFGVAFLVGTYLLWVSIRKPSFFWESSQARSLRYRWGDRQAQAFYGGIGALLLGILCFTYGLAYMSVQLLHIGIFAVVVLGGIQLYRWSHQSRPSARGQQLNRQRQKLSQLIRR